MTRPFQWTPHLIARALHLNKTEVIETIAVDIGCSTETVRMKLIALSVQPFKRPKHNSANNSVLKPPKEQYQGRYEDHPDADRDRWVGRRPTKRVVYSQTGCSAEMCVGG
jgi:hypothetical protein